MKNYLLIALLSISCINTSLLSAPNAPNGLPAYRYWIGGGLAGATLIGAYFTYKAFKKSRAEENNFSEIREFLKEKGAIIKEWSQYGYDGCDYREDNLEITPNPNWTNEEYTIGKEYMHKLESAFHAKNASNKFVGELFGFTAVPLIFGVIYFHQLFKDLKSIK